MADDFLLDMAELNPVAVSLNHAAAEARPLAEIAVRKTALDIEATSKAFAPVDTGALRNSIGSDIHADGEHGSIEAEIGPTVKYAPYLEFGTSRMAPRAFMGPALDRHAPSFVQALEQLGGEVL